MIEIYDRYGKKRCVGRKSWFLRKRSRGDAPMTCLGIIIATIALGVWAYYYFWHNRALERAGQDITIAKSSDTGSINAYRFRVRDRLMPATLRVNRNARKAVTPIYKNKVKDEEQTLLELTKCEEEMRELITDINEVIVPTKFADSHRNMAICVGSDWEAVCTARKAFKASEKPIKDQLIKESKKQLSKGNKACEAAEMATKAMFNK